jgi:hypothetical protein
LAGAFQPALDPVIVVAQPVNPDGDMGGGLGAVSRVAPQPGRGAGDFGEARAMFALRIL